MADGAARLAPHELERIGILLLRHQAAAGRHAVGDLQVAELLAAEDDDVLRDAAEVHHGQRARVERRRDEVAVRGRVDAVRDDARETEPAGQRRGVDRVARACDRPGSERHGIRLAARRAEARVVTPQRRRVGEEEVRRQHRLGAPQVRVGRHEHGPGPIRLRRQRRHQIHERALQHRQAPAEIEPQVERDLLVARAAGVQAAGGVAYPLHELPLDERVHVLVVARHEVRVAATDLANVAQGRADGGGLLGGEHPGAFERLRPRDASLDVVLEQPPVEGERRLEPKDLLVGSTGEAAGPEMLRVGHRGAGGGRAAGVGRHSPRATPAAAALRPGARLAAVSTGRPQILMNPSAASWSKRSPSS